MPNSFDPHWFAQNCGPLFKEWLHQEYRGNVGLVARLFAVSDETVHNWIRLSSTPHGAKMMGALIAFPSFRERAERAYQKHLAKRDAAIIRAARERQKARRSGVAA